MAAGDSMNGGKSTSIVQVLQPGAEDTRGALQVSGEIVAAGQPFTWAGVLYSPGQAPMQSVNLSGKKSSSFWAKGDGKTYTLIVLTEGRSGNSGEMPAMTTFAAGSEWKQYTFPFSTFETDGSDLAGLGFVHAQEPGKFQFEIDELQIK
jgi:hypothetical protein